jgi:hypothetical protein
MTFREISTAQSTLVVPTGFIWSRYSFVIILKIWNLFADNSFGEASGTSQFFCIWRYNQELKAKAIKRPYHLSNLDVDITTGT